VRLSREHDFREPLVWVLNVATRLAMLSGDRTEQARQYGIEALELAEKSGSPFLMAFALRNIAIGHLVNEAWQDAEIAIEQSLETARTSHVGLEREADLLVLLSQAKLGSGSVSGARASAEQAITKAKGQGTRYFEAQGELALACALRAEGRLEAAREALARVTAGIAETGGRAIEPVVSEEEARLDQLEGSDPAPALARARELYSSIGAKGHADRIARELAELS
jgi:hypothetical protein